MSGGLTDAQVQFARDQLSSVTRFRVLPEIVETVLFAIFTVLICVSSYVLISKGRRNWPSRVMLALTLFMYAVSALAWAVDIKIMWNELNVYIPELLSPTRVDGEDADATSNPLDGVGVLLFTSDVFSQINIVLSDAVVLWRACVVWNRHKAIVGATILILLSLLGVCILDILSFSGYYLTHVPTPVLSLSSDLDQIGLALFSLSAFANIFATGTVACKAWIHRRDIRRYLKKRTTSSAVESVLTLLVESGTVYSIFVILLLLTDIPSLGPVYSGPFTYYWGNVMNQISGMYPTLIIVLVALQRSHLEHQFSFEAKEPDNTLPFSVRAPQSLTSIAFNSAPRAHTSLLLDVSQDLSDPDASSNPSRDMYPPHEKRAADV